MIFVPKCCPRDSSANIRLWDDKSHWECGWCGLTGSTKHKYGAKEVRS